MKKLTHDSEKIDRSPKSRSGRLAGAGLLLAGLMALGGAQGCATTSATARPAQTAQSQFGREGEVCGVMAVTRQLPSSFEILDMVRRGDVRTEGNPLRTLMTRVEFSTDEFEGIPFPTIKLGNIWAVSVLIIPDDRSRMLVETMYNVGNMESLIPRGPQDSPDMPNVRVIRFGDEIAAFPRAVESVSGSLPSSVRFYIVPEREQSERMTRVDTLRVVSHQVDMMPNGSPRQMRVYILPQDAQGNLIGEYNGGNLAIEVSFTPGRPQDRVRGAIVLLYQDGIVPPQ